MASRRRWGWGPALAGVLLVAGCAPESTPLLRQDLDRVRADLLRVGETLRQNQADLKADLQQSDQRSAQTLTEIQRSVARLGARLDDLGRETSQIQGRLDDLRRRVDAVALQFDVGGMPSPTGPPPRAGAAPPRSPSGAAPAAPAPAGALATAPPPAPAAAPSAVNPASQASELYQTAYNDYTRGNYSLAIAAFQEVIRLYPTTELAEKAQYWIGESHFSLAQAARTRGERDKAVQEFGQAVQELRKVLINYPRGDRVPSALYKEALALVEVGQPSVAEARLQFLVDQFPATEEAAKAKEELARLRKR